jgi:hypothetical protein
LDDFYAYDGITGMADAYSEKEIIRLYPNPCVRNFTIAAADPQISTVTILDAEGRDVTSDFSISKAGNGFEITVLDAASGMYSACMMSANGNSLAANPFVITAE